MFALVVLGIWVLLLLWTRRGASTSDSRHSHKSMLLWLRNNVSTWIALAFAISYFVLPSHMRFVSVIAERLVVPTFLFAALIPRCDRLDRRQLCLKPGESNRLPAGNAAAETQTRSPTRILRLPADLR